MHIHMYKYILDTVSDNSRLDFWKNLIKMWIQNCVFFFIVEVWSVYKMWSQMSMIILVTHLTRRLLCFLTHIPAPVFSLTLSYCLSTSATADLLPQTAASVCPTVLQDVHAHQIIHTRHLTQSLPWVFWMQIEKFHLHFTYFDLCM